MTKISEQANNLITSCIVQRLSTKESLEFLSKNNVEMGERTFRRYKQQILLQRNTLDKYSRQNIQLEQLQKIETKKSVLKHLWNLFENAVKISDKLSILKSIEKTSDNLPTILWNANEYGKKIKIEKKMQEFNKNSIWNDP
jgi:predicted nuclease with TOPRIM domain